MTGAPLMLMRDVLAAFGNLPVRDLDAIAPGTAMILAPHPDDESLGCGGFIAEATRRGRPPVVVVVSDGAASHPGSRMWPTAKLARQRRLETCDATAVLGLTPDRLHFLELPDTAVPIAGDVFDAAVLRIAALARLHGCTTLLLPWRHDPHCDHEATWLIGLASGRAVPDLSILAYPVWGLTLAPETMLEQATPSGARLDIAHDLDAKRSAVRAHRSQTGVLIDDAPDGFVLPDALLDAICTRHEIFIGP